tara:strand:- start:322 stop:600 length:279 start_codon:yes stop_codon:yes gene_type:complete
MVWRYNLLAEKGFADPFVFLHGKLVTLRKRQDEGVGIKYLQNSSFGGLRLTKPCPDEKLPVMTLIGFSGFTRQESWVIQLYIIGRFLLFWEL